jgi:putative membrane protein
LFIRCLLFSAGHKQETCRDWESAVPIILHSSAVFQEQTGRGEQSIKARMNYFLDVLLFGLIATASPWSDTGTTGSCCHAWSTPYVSSSAHASARVILPRMRPSTIKALQASVRSSQQQSTSSMDQDDNNNMDVDLSTILIMEQKEEHNSNRHSNKLSGSLAMMAGLLATATALLPVEAATAADVASSSPIMSAVVAYGHYLSFIIMTGCLVTERLTIKGGMSTDDEQLVAKADIAYGLSGALLVYTGVLRASQYGKGFDFYSHEPLFWVKMILVGVWGAASLFNTFLIIQRSVALAQQDKLQPMTDKMAARMNQLLNAQLLALGSIPLTATLMSRGIGYNASIPWQIEAALVPLVFGGLGYKYVKEALDWKEDDIDIIIPAAKSSTTTTLES